jgi:hypothetical protein
VCTMVWRVVKPPLGGAGRALKRAVRLTWALVGIGLLGTFPPAYQHVALWF